MFIRKHPVKSAIAAIILIPVCVYLFVVVSDYLANIECSHDAKTLITLHGFKLPLKRCSRKTYITADWRHKISRVYVVVGNVSRQWEFECGYMAPNCARFSGWLDENGKPIDMSDPPSTVNHDPSVYTLGCGEDNSFSIYDIAIKPQLVYRDGAYWWQIDYNNTPASKNPLCILNGTSLVGYKVARSSVQAQYQFDTGSCPGYPPTRCQTAQALLHRSVLPCRYNDSYSAAYYGSFDYKCVTDYISQTHDRSMCGVQVNDADVNCGSLTFIEKL